MTISIKKDRVYYRYNIEAINYITAIILQLIEIM